MSAELSREAKPLAVTIGEPSGVGPDVLLLAYSRRSELQLPVFLILADPAMVRQRALRLGLPVRVKEIAAPAEAVLYFAEALPVLPLANLQSETPRQIDPHNALGTLEAIDRATALALGGAVGGIVTAPIDKKALYDAGFSHPGHTEYLAELCQNWTGSEITPVMLLTGPELSCVPVTIHIPLAEVPAQLTRELIVRTGRIVAADYRSRFGFAKPRLAVAGLNPHAGEKGSIGSEDERIVRPAVENLQAEGIDAVGPLPADTMFHPEARSRYDVALCMYHDQALIPAKTLAFDETVNTTLGLPIIRTSPDHGTAADIAGTGLARPDSFIAAVRLAARMAAREEESRPSAIRLQLGGQ